MEEFDELFNRRPVYDFGDEQYLRKADVKVNVKNFLKSSLQSAVKDALESKNNILKVQLDLDMLRALNEGDVVSINNDVELYPPGWTKNNTLFVDDYDIKPNKKFKQLPKTSLQDAYDKGSQDALRGKHIYEFEFIEQVSSRMIKGIQRAAVKDALESTRLDRKTQEILDMLPKFSDDETVEMVETKILECVFEAQQKLITKAIKSYEKD